jgi:hypothetical protein
VVIWEKVDGKWKLDSDIWNLNRYCRCNFPTPRGLSLQAVVSAVKEGPSLLI